MEKEELERGSVSYTVYLHYVRNFGVLLLLVGFLFSGLFTGFSIATNFWLSAWSESGLKNSVS